MNMETKQKLRINNSKTKIVYTIILNDYDYIKDPLIIHPDWEYILITDNPNLKSDYWRIHVIDEKDKYELLQRELKICPHKFFNEYNHIFYVDGSVHIQAFDPESLVENTKADLICKWHPINKNAYDEAAACVALNKGVDEEITKQIDSYKAQGLPESQQTYETGYMYRKTTPEMFSFCDLWFKELEEHTKRDQISLPFVVWKYASDLNIQVAQFTPEGWGKNFIQAGHVTTKEKYKVHYFTPYAPDMNLGKAYNEACESVPDGEWIALMDADSMFLNNKYGLQVQDIIERHGKNIGLIGCTTNRLKDTAQLYQGKHSEVSDILHHKEIADYLFKQEYSNIKLANKPIAGLFMLFNKDLWKTNKFKNGLMSIDTDFCFRLADRNIPIGIAKGLYMLHYYRLKEGIQHIEHLKSNKIEEANYRFNKNNLTMDSIVNFIEKSGLLKQAIDKGLSSDMLKYLKRVE